MSGEVRGDCSSVEVSLKKKPIDHDFRFIATVLSFSLKTP